MSKTIYLAGGCFWGLEKYLRELPGVLRTEVGYANGPGCPPGEAAPPVSYEEVCASSGHVEAVKLTYDPAVAPLRFYLEQVFKVIDPVAVNRQGGDVGVQYRTGVYWTDAADRLPVELELATLGRRLSQPLAVEAGPLRGFTPAEDHHQRYLDKNPSGYCHISPAAMAAARAARPAPPTHDAARSRPSSPADPAPPPGDGAARIDGAAAEAGAWGVPAHRPGEAGGAGTASLAVWSGLTAPDPARLAALSQTQRAVTADGATEPPFTGELTDVFEPGVYVDVTSGAPLFASSQKFESGCGWPAFARPISPERIRQLEDRSYGMERTEVRSAGSGAHLGHVFDDGPPELGGLRYCVNSAALEFVPLAQMEARGYGALVPLVESA
ncbi:MAG: peptide-methionine (R)-S-oxide reductase MsrB [Bifidobacteriaceae bacterium]|jgi:peptide methionine sulfoxide reductase msrA/msrB|nr:peptide-methionine (R)-S-oxide reductase MsrB [Bifidobacteriaceae bacterium]